MGRRANGEGTIKQRKDGRYEAQVFVRTPDGQWKRKSVYGKTWEECNNKKVELQDANRRGIPVATTKLTVADYFAYWLHEVAEPSVRRTTFSSYEGLTRLYIVPGLGKKKLTAQHIRAWLNAVGKTCQCCAQGKDAKWAEKPDRKPRCCARQPKECCKSFPAPASLRYLLRLLRAALQDAVEEDILTRNVATLVKLPGSGKRQHRAWSLKEARQFLATAKDHRLYALWAVGLGIGLRRGEALGLRWEDVDLAGGRVTIAQALHRVDGKLTLDEVKTEASAATVPLPAPLVSVLQRHKALQAGDRLAAGPRWRDTGLVFTTPHGTPIEPRNINRAFEALCRKAGVRVIRVHDMRHTAATVLFAMGVDAATVQRILRHSSISVTTGTYIEVIESVQRDAVDRMGVLFEDAAEK
ncbi:tyrosine-type recombinase/integrase [Saccharothrix syringae]|uniref:Site-specific integrase n=1 Tax=Saccharothrix syringae TaxID=103733 RepID=A0A5Q0GS60_SACSY|nr:site-specific integrase [Saccharothrix syringae]QFZ16202.1 site-specific integrase [Saccharothrix syringae]